MSELVIVGDEAWTREEWERAERQHAKRREYEKRPDVLARKAAYWREYRKQPHVKAYQREWKRKDRAARKPIASLHSLRCWGPHQRPRKYCTPILGYSKNQDVAA